MANPSAQSKPKSLHNLLTYAGVTPFAAGAICINLDVGNIPLLGNVADAISAYGLIIASFLSGGHWVTHLQKSGGLSVFLALTSNAVAVGLWMAFLVLAPSTFLLLLSAAFIFLLGVDKRLAAENLITPMYFKTRVVVTCIVVSLLIWSGFLI